MIAAQSGRPVSPDQAARRNPTSAGLIFNESSNRANPPTTNPTPATPQRVSGAYRSQRRRRTANAVSGAVPSGPAAGEPPA